MVDVHPRLSQVGVFASPSPRPVRRNCWEGLLWGRDGNHRPPSLRPHEMAVPGRSRCSSSELTSLHLGFIPILHERVFLINPTFPANKPEEPANEITIAAQPAQAVSLDSGGAAHAGYRQSGLVPGLRHSHGPDRKCIPSPDQPHAGIAPGGIGLPGPGRRPKLAGHAHPSYGPHAYEQGRIPPVKGRCYRMAAALPL